MALRRSGPIFATIIMPFFFGTPVTYRALKLRPQSYDRDMIQRRFRVTDEIPVAIRFS